MTQAGRRIIESAKQARELVAAMTERDFDSNPYSPDEQRVALWLADKTGAGGGDDPIGFMIASHEALAAQGARNRPLVTYDPECGASYIRLAGDGGKGSVAVSISATSNITLDFDADGRLIGIELLRERLLHPALRERAVHPADVIS